MPTEFDIRTGFRFDTSKPADNRTTFATIAERDTLPESVRRRGMECYVTATNLYYSLTGGESTNIGNTAWEQRMGGSSDPNDGLTQVASDASLNGLGTSASPLSVNDAEIAISQSQVTDLTTDLGNKQDTISDLGTIRSGAAEGATALQPGDDIPISDVTDLQAELNGKLNVPTGQTEAVVPTISSGGAQGTVNLDTVVNPTLQNSGQPLSGNATVYNFTDDISVSGTGSTKTINVDVANVTEVLDNTNHRQRTDNPHSVTATQVGLGNVNNTSDADKPVSTATQTALDAKVNTIDTNALNRTLTGANVLATLQTNEQGQVIGYTTRALTPAEIGAGSSTGSDATSIHGIPVQDDAGVIADNDILKFNQATGQLEWEPDTGGSTVDSTNIIGIINGASETINAARIPTLNQDTTGNSASADTVDVSTSSANQNQAVLTAAGTDGLPQTIRGNGSLTYNHSTNLLNVTNLTISGTLTGDGSQLTNLPGGQGRGFSVEGVAVGGTGAVDFNDNQTPTASHRVVTFSSGEDNTIQAEVDITGLGGSGGDVATALDYNNLVSNQDLTYLTDANAVQALVDSNSLIPDTIYEFPDVGTLIGNTSSGRGGNQFANQQALEDFITNKSDFRDDIFPDGENEYRNVDLVTRTGTQYSTQGITDAFNDGTTISGATILTTDAQNPILGIDNTNALYVPGSIVVFELLESEETAVSSSVYFHAEVQSQIEQVTDGRRYFFTVVSISDTLGSLSNTTIGPWRIRTVGALEALTRVKGAGADGIDDTWLNDTIARTSQLTTALPFSSITSTPTTLAGYGITDGGGSGGTQTFFTTTNNAAQQLGTRSNTTITPTPANELRNFVNGSGRANENTPLAYRHPSEADFDAFQAVFASAQVAFTNDGLSPTSQTEPYTIWCKQTNTTVDADNNIFISNFLVLQVSEGLLNTTETNVPQNWRLGYAPSPEIGGTAMADFFGDIVRLPSPDGAGATLDVLPNQGVQNGAALYVNLTGATVAVATTTIATSNLTQINAFSGGTVPELTTFESGVIVTGGIETDVGGGLISTSSAPRISLTDTGASASGDAIASVLTSGQDDSGTTNPIAFQQTIMSDATAGSVDGEWRLNILGNSDVTGTLLANPVLQVTNTATAINNQLLLTAPGFTLPTAGNTTNLAVNNAGQVVAGTAGGGQSFVDTTVATTFDTFGLGTTVPIPNVTISNIDPLVTPSWTVGDVGHIAAANDTKVVSFVVTAIPTTTTMTVTYTDISKGNNVSSGLWMLYPGFGGGNADAAIEAGVSEFGVVEVDMPFTVADIVAGTDNYQITAVRIHNLHAAGDFDLVAHGIVLDTININGLGEFTGTYGISQSNINAFALLPTPITQITDITLRRAGGSEGAPVSERQGGGTETLATDGGLTRVGGLQVDNTVARAHNMATLSTTTLASFTGGVGPGVISFAVRFGAGDSALIATTDANALNLTAGTRYGVNVSADIGSEITAGTYTMIFVDTTSGAAGAGTIGHNFQFVRRVESGIEGDNLFFANTNDNNTAGQDVTLHELTLYGQEFAHDVIIDGSLILDVDNIPASDPGIRGHIYRRPDAGEQLLLISI